MPQKVHFHQNLEIDFSDQCNTFSILRIAEKVKMFVDTITLERLNQF